MYIVHKYNKTMYNIPINVDLPFICMKKMYIFYFLKKN